MKFKSVVLLALFFQSAAFSAPLTRDEIALVVNRAVPQGIELANFYAQARGIPADRIIQLDLPTTDEIPFDRYERDIAPPIREFLRSHGLQNQVRCLVTFYGVPLRVSDRFSGPRDMAEQIRLRNESSLVIAELSHLVSEVETRAFEYDSSFKPATINQALETLVRRGNEAGKSLAASLHSTNDPNKREEIQKYLSSEMARLQSPVNVAGDEEKVAPATAPAANDLQLSQERAFDPQARDHVRELVRRSGGIVAYARLLQDQIEYLATPATASAVDSELACIWWPPLYAREQWRTNPLNFHLRGVQSPRTMMIMRLDAPTEKLVKDLITDSIAVEHDGLKGKLVVDARGISPLEHNGNDNAFGIFDQHLRDLAALVHEKTAIEVQLDDNPSVLGVNSASDVAMYCGWYSVRNYVPGMKFNRGAVGYHVASFELLTLHDPHETGWVRGLMFGGVVGTLGAVAEPYLHSFPLPNEFFPLLMTGKLTLAETYWTTTPCVSWMQSCIGDPLYNPYAKNPAMKVEDLPETLRPAIQ